MPRFSSSAPRKKLPPPTTAATWTPRRTTWAICREISWTTSGSTPIAPPPKTSPDSLRTTRRGRGPVPTRAGTANSSATVSTIAPPCVGTNLSRPRPLVVPGYASGEARTGTPARRPPRRVDLGLPHFEVDEPAHRDPGLLEDLGHGLLLVLYGRLLDQDEVLEEAVDPTVDDPRQGGLGLALLARGLLGDAPLGGDHVLGYLVAGEVLRAHRRDLHRDAPGLVVGGLVGLALVLHQDTDRGRQVGALAVQVHRDGGTVAEHREAVEHDLLTDLGGVLLHGLPDRTPGGQLAAQQRLEVGRPGRGRVLDQGLREPDELLVLGDEVGLAVELEQCPARVRDQPVGGGTPGPLVHVLRALDAQDLDGLVAVAARLLPRLLTVHHPGAGQVPELLDVRGSEVRHHSLSRSVGFRQASAGAVSPLAPPPSSSSRSHSASGSSAATMPGSGFSSAVRPEPRPDRAIRPSATASATTRVSSAAERIASSLPGIG